MKKDKHIVVWSNHPDPPADSVVRWRDPLENVLISLGYDLRHSPQADLLKRYHDLRGNWVVISPVYFHTTHNDAVIAQYGSELGLDEEKGQWYFDKVREFFQHEGVKLHYHSPTLWLGQLDSPAPINSFSPAYLHNKSIMPYLEQLGEDMSWQKRVTEGQMFLQSLNPIVQNDSNFNGLWFWGQGELSKQQAIIVSDDTNMLRLTEIWPGLTIQTSFEESNLRQSDNVFLTRFTWETFKIIEKVSRSFSCNWYWNNIIYQQPAKRWWQVFRRK